MAATTDRRTDGEVAPAGANSSAMELDTAALGALDQPNADQRGHAPAAGIGTARPGGPDRSTPIEQRDADV